MVIPEHITDTPRLSVCIPAYGRPEEYALLLKSIEAQTQFPHEVLICEDGSPQRDALRDITTQFASRMRVHGLVVRFIENPINLGYDGNLRRLIELATGTHVFFIGNDDFILPDGIQIAQRFLMNNQVLAASRSFARFDHDPLKPIGYSRQIATDTSISKASHPAGIVMRIGGFFGGLIFDRNWALQHSTQQYDGTLYYQIYLLLEAYCHGTIGYMATPTVAARADNAPLFGSAKSEKSHFTPGRYSAQARGRMWESILTITSDVEKKNQVALIASMRSELAGRMSFHLFEMFAGRSTAEQRQLKEELNRLGLFDHWMPKTLYIMNTLLGSHSAWVYQLARRSIQR
ncbi:glycosyltransferase family A protein [Variovorax sp. PCZ-1]|uniref:glycosyltransferase family 2 protein n=1 Tax=Variovorax sp. PCZ-1 TaxID=2835533 RepID=UPI001BCC9475|nr:glycosyltransferase family A protein [Variovorax sp. PCZ-1]MBS7808576.1 glycosyltransferase family 2 protein [Variovorax sp. PCZ-1]